MGFGEDDQTRDALRTGFDRAAEDYERTRPICPPRLFGDLIDLAGLEAGRLFCRGGEPAPSLAGSLPCRGLPANLATQSNARALGEAGRAEFLARVRRRLESLGRPPLTATFVGYLIVGRRA
jgi:hypothetical protein